MFGHEKVFVLDGGLKKYKSLGGKTENGKGKAFKSDFKSSKLSTHCYFDKLYKKVTSLKKYQILDARSHARFTEMGRKRQDFSLVTFQNL